MDSPELKRSLSLGLLTLYGLGTTIGAGIFVLIGKVAGAAGVLAPLSFLLAAAIAGLSALSFSEMASRFPESAGEAVYVKEGLNSNALALLIGLTVAGAGIVSAATIVVGFSGYFADIVPIPRGAAEFAVTLVLAAIAVWGIRASVSIAGLVTLAEIGVLVLIVGFGVWFQSGDSVRPEAVPVDRAALEWSGVIYGAILAFYAFIGFEDIVNVAEETRDARKIIPRAIILTLAVTTVLYAAIALLAVSTVAPAMLAASDAPLTLLFERVSGLPGDTITVIAIVSVLNGALVQIIMASRVLYGLTRRGWLPGPFGQVNSRTRTPVAAILLCAAAIVVLVASFDLEHLAVVTSSLTLLVFVAVNASLLRLRISRSATDHRGFRVPLAVPVLAIASITGLVFLQLYSAF